MPMDISAKCMFKLPGDKMESDEAVKTPMEEVEGGWIHQLVVYAAR